MTNPVLFLTLHAVLLPLVKFRLVLVRYVLSVSSLTSLNSYGSKICSSMGDLSGSDKCSVNDVYVRQFYYIIFSEFGHETEFFIIKF